MHESKDFTGLNFDMRAASKDRTIPVYPAGPGANLKRKQVAMKKLLGLVLLAATLGVLPLARAADDPTLQEVNNAVRAGRLADAQSMMLTVLRDHPKSAKAHFVEAEVLSRLQRRDEARRELALAEELEPGLTSIRSSTVEDLRHRLDGGAAPSASFAPRAEPHESSGFPVMPVILLVGAGIVIFLVLRARRPAVMGGPGMMPGGAPPAPYGYGQGGMPYGAPAGGPGIGSGILGGLATGAAVGAGVVAGEALAHEIMGGHEHSSGNAWADDGSRGAPPDRSDLGVDGGWDSGGSGGGMDLGGGGSDDWG